MKKRQDFIVINEKMLHELFPKETFMLNIGSYTVLGEWNNIPVLGMKVTLEETVCIIKNAIFENNYFSEIGSIEDFHNINELTSIHFY